MKEFSLEYPVTQWLPFYRNHKELRTALVEKFGLCFWCKIPVKEYGKNYRRGESVPRNQATIDHLKTRFERKQYEVVPKVLCCYGCNQKRARTDSRKFQRKKPPQKRTPYKRGPSVS